LAAGADIKLDFLGHRISAGVVASLLDNVQIILE
jgi:hypothetical protein